MTHELHLWPTPIIPRRVANVRRHLEKGTPFWNRSGQPVSRYDIPPAMLPKRVVVHVTKEVTYSVTVQNV